MRLFSHPGPFQGGRGSRTALYRLPGRGGAGMIAVMRPFAFLLLLAACASPTAATDGRWFGDMTPEQPSQVCQPGRASLVSTRDAVLFTPNEGTQTLTGTITPARTVTAERTTTGTDKKPYVMTLAARIEDGVVTGTYATPRCRYAVRLTRS